MTPQKWKKRYHNCYRECLGAHDPHVIQYIISKEEIIVTHPSVHPFLGYKLKGIRKFASGKVRILYVLSTERPDLWNPPSEEEEILFLYVGLRNEHTYEDVEKIFSKHGVI